MIGLARCVFDSREDVFALNIGVIFQDLFEARSRAEEVKDVGHPNSHATDTGTPSALSVIDCDAAETV